MPLATASLNDGVGGVTGAIGNVSLHTANPGATGTNEVTGGGYARKAPTWGTASGGISNLSNAPLAFDGPPGQAITHVGLWSSGGAWKGSFVPTGDLAFNAAGDLNVTGISVTGTAT